tara:strand:+ start:887 stop:1480 length:594 start_codon:yes stop_codon:yes gene_type:complete
MAQLLTHNGISVDPFPKLIWKFKYSFDFQAIKSLITELVAETPRNSKLETGAAFSTASVKFDPPHTWPELREFREWLHSPLHQVWTNHNYNPYATTSVLNSWINTHKKTGTTLEHSHSHVALVVTAYLNLPKDSGFIEFRDPLEYHKHNTPVVPEEELWKEVPCETNDILIFPGWLKHRVQPNKVDEDRVVLTMNIG